LAADPLRIVGHIENGASQERLVPQPSRLAKPLVGVGKNQFDILILLRGGRNDKARHESTTSRAILDNFRGPPARRADEVNELLFALNHHSLPPV
jgi:hypothetical protein